MHTSLGNSTNPSPVEAKFYTNSGNPLVLRLVPDSASTVLDLGCGAGDNARHLSSKGMLVDGITLSPDEAKFASRYCQNVYVHNLEQGVPPNLRGPYDIVICSHVLEHLCFPSALLRSIKGVLAENGSVIVAIPNLLWWKNRLKLLCGRFEYTESGVMDSTHFRWYTFKTIQDLLESHGFNVQIAIADGCFPLWKLRRFVSRVVANRLDEFACSMFPGFFGYQFILSAKPISR